MATIQDLITQTIETRNIEEPFYVVDVEDMIKKHQNFLSKMPRVRPFYAVKCNSSPVVLEILALLGAGFDCASKVEISSVLDTQVGPSSIIYANPVKSNAYLRYAQSVGVDLMTFDNEEELYKIADVYPEARLVIRIKVDDSHSKYHLGDKYGASLSKVGHLLFMAKNLGLNVVGVAFHVGSDCNSEEAYKFAIKDAKKVFEIGYEFGFDFNLLDIGGGFPGSSDNKDTILFDKISEVVNKSLDYYFPEEMNINIIAEPGRYYVCSAFTLSAQIIGKKMENDADENRLQMYYINDGTYGSFSATTFGPDEVEPIPHLTRLELSRRKIQNSTIWGPTCDSLDCVRRRIMLPEMYIGEWMSFKDMGAYTVSIGTRFNGFQMPMVKCHVSAEAIEFLRNVPGWNRICSLLGIKDKLGSHSLVHRFWDFIHIQ